MIKKSAVAASNFVDLRLRYYVIEFHTHFAMCSNCESHDLPHGFDQSTADFVF